MSEPQQPAPPYSGQQHPAQPYPGQQYPAQPHPGQQYPAQPYPTSQPGAGAGASSGASLGRLAFIIALVSLGIGLVVTLTYPAIIRMSYDSTLIGAFGTIGNGLVFIVAVVALILGLMAVRRPGSPVLGGIAIGISASAVVSIAVSWVSNLLYAFAF